MWVPVAGLPCRLAPSALAGVSRLCVWKTAAKTRGDQPRRGLSESSPQPLPCLEFGDSAPWVSKHRLEPKRYVTSRRLAETLAQILRRTQKDPRHLLLECNPGPGVLTQALLETGAKVVALESDRNFIPHLESLGNNLHGKLEVVHCDFFKLDPRNCGLVKPPIMLSQELFQSLGIKALRWSAANPLKIIGIFPVKNERKVLWKLLYDLYSCTSIYRHGRVELNMFISEKEYKKLMANPRNPSSYQVLSVLWQVACEIKVLHMEPWSSFDVYIQNGQLEMPKRKDSLELIQQNMYFVQMTPRRNLFTENLTPVNYDVFFHMVKHCFGKRSARLIEHLKSLSPVDAMDILMQTRKNETVKITEMYPQDFKRLFETIECSKDHSCKWLYDDSMEDTVIGN
ncbi:dimethyladenosine transferase 2, mitochondrial [Ochotona princeps]|uniref:dimethyladenosine transferase 2, mitochondrial n=1 Tax=Ochotona princeps TaxID=9978 RepID=UPI002714500D|nr:dimethyladenosine transferase 2, mitochondrial [Ochotona princeps]